MISKRTGVGISVGSVIIAIGAFALFTSIGLQTTEVDDTLGLGESESYRINAPEHATQTMKITGDSFEQFFHLHLHTLLRCHLWWLDHQVASSQVLSQIQIGLCSLIFFVLS